MTTLDLMAVMFGLGATAVIAGFLPSGRPSAHDALKSLAPSPDQGDEGMTAWARNLSRAPWMRRWFGPIDGDLVLTETLREQLVIKVARSAVLATGGLFLLFTALGFAPLWSLLAGLAIGVAAGALEVRALRSRADDRRRQLVEVAQTLLTLTSVGVHGSKPIAQVAADSLAHLDGWSGRVLRQAYWEGTADQLSIGETLQRFADRVNSPPLALYADTVRSGERNTVGLETIAHRSNSLQVQLAQRLVIEAGKRQEAIIIPVIVFALLVMALAMFYPLSTTALF